MGHQVDLPPLLRYYLDKPRGEERMSNRDDSELFVVKRWHIYVLVASVLSFIAGMTVRSLLMGPLPYYVIASTSPAVASSTATPTQAGVPATPTAPPAPVAEPPSPTTGMVEASPDDDPAIGPPEAPVLIIEFSDFQCGFCGRFARETLAQILETYGDQVRFVHRDFPLSSIHPHAQKAAEAAQCANEQGKYWDYSDVLYQNQTALEIESLNLYAEQLGLDADAFSECLDSGRYKEEVEKDLTDGRSYGVTATPTFFINGQLLVGAKPFSAFQAVIEEELAQ